MTKPGQRATLSVSEQTPLARMAALKGKANYGEVAEAIIERYSTVISRSIPDFSNQEWCLIFDALRPPWQADENSTSQLAAELSEAINADQLGAKWQVDAQRLKSRVDRLSFSSRQAIGEMTEIFWNTRPLENYEHIIQNSIAALNARTGREQPKRDTPRISPERLERQPSQAGTERDQPESPTEKPETAETA